MKLINGWTKESVMAQIKKHNDGNRAMIDGNCTYLSNSGNRCAIGCFIPDELIEKVQYVEYDAYLLVHEFPKLNEFMPFSIEWLTSFQRSHDTAKNGQVYESIQRFLDEKVEE